MTDLLHPAPPEAPAAETREPMTAERLAEIRAWVSDENAPACVSEMLGEIARLTAELSAIREAVSADEDETTLAAVEWMATEWRHYSKEMHRAGYETIPKLEQELQASREREAAIRRAMSQVREGLRLVDRGVMEWTDAKRVDLAIDRLEALLAAPEHADQEGQI